MQSLFAFGRNDALQIRREAILMYMLVIPLLSALVFRLFLPLVARWLQAAQGVDLLPYYPLLASFLGVQIGLMYGLLMGLLALDERDEGVLTLLQVTPLPLSSYAGYRIVAAVLLTTLATPVLLPLSGMLPWSLAPALLPIGLGLGMLAPVMGLLLPTLASNKVEGMAVMKGLGLFILVPLAAYFVAEPWQYLLGIVPSYLPAKALWLAAAGEPFLPLLALGVIYAGGLTAVLLWRFRHKLTEPRRG